MAFDMLMIWIKMKISTFIELRKLLKVVKETVSK